MWLPFAKRSSIGGDADTIACITGGIAEVMFGLLDEIAEASLEYLTDDLIEVVDRFQSTKEETFPKPTTTMPSSSPSKTDGSISIATSTALILVN